MMNEFIVLAILKLESEEERNFMANLYINYRALMKKKAFGYVDNNYDAEEIVQIAFLKLIEKVARLKTLECCKLTAYIVSTIETTSLDFIRSRKRSSNSMFLFGDDDVIQDIPDIDTPEKIIAENYDKEIIHKAIKKLNPKYKIIIEGKYFLNMPDKEIAEILNIKPKSVREYLTRARKALQKILETEYDLNGYK